MSRLLHAPALGDAARRLAAPAPVLDQATRELLARVEADAFARGRAEGQRAAEQEAAAAADRVNRALADAVATVTERVRADAAARAAEVVTVARQLAEAVLDHELASGGRALLDRVQAAVDALDHGPFTIHVATVDHDLLADHRHGLPDGAVLEVDPRLAPGEARITGPWSGADLTLDAVLASLVEESA